MKLTLHKGEIETTVIYISVQVEKFKILSQIWGVIIAIPCALGNLKHAERRYFAVYGSQIF